MKNTNYFFIIVIFLSACGTQKKIEDTRQILDASKMQQQQENARIDSLSKRVNDILKQGKIDQHIDTVIQKKLDAYVKKLDVAKDKTEGIDSLINQKKEFRENYKSFVLPALDSLKQSNASYAERMKLYLMMENMLDIANYNLYDLAAFFGPGKYIIPIDKIGLAEQSFSPIVDSLMKFSNRYSEIPKTATLVILGFADETGFSDDTNLLDTLRALAGDPNASKKELNLKLSELRSKELIKRLMQALITKASSYNNYQNLRIEYIGQGKGEALPLPTISDYSTDDPRRRIVLCYWIVLPD
ncbi:MAG: hypothetical protein WDN26_04930 [Chitinophagaceae bacterium]